MTAATTPPPDSGDPEQVLAVREQYVDSGRQAPYQVVTLTDEEIVAIDGPETVAPRFWYDAQPPASRETALEVASRGLVARGWATADPTALSVAELGLEAAGPLLAVLGLRREARLIVVCEQQLEGETRARVLYLLHGGMSLEEAVNSGGLHRFSTMTTSRAHADLAAWCDPFEMPRPVDPVDTRLDAGADLATVDAGPLADTRVVTVVAAVSGRSDHPVDRRLTVYGTADRLLLAVREGQHLRLRDVDRTDLVDRLADMVE